MDDDRVLDGPETAEVAAVAEPARGGGGLGVWWSTLGARLGERERGDVPGWVLVTLMTAGLVTALWLIAGPALQGVFTDAIDSVTGP